MNHDYCAMNIIIYDSYLRAFKLQTAGAEQAALALHELAALALALDAQLQTGRRSGRCQQYMTNLHYTQHF